MPIHEKVLLVGASVRAAAHSAWRAGWRDVRCLDLFADRDLASLYNTRSVPLPDYPHGLIAALGRDERGPTIFTGALENRPDLLARLPQPLWGCTPSVVRRIRDPRRWHAALRDAGLPCPDTAFEPSADRNRPWLIKPIRSGGGLGIHVWRGQEFQSRTHFLQQRLDGEPCSAIYLGQDGAACLLGVTRQLVGVPWLHVGPFGYAGSIGPLRLDAASLDAWNRLGTALAHRFQIVGLFGVDAMLRDGVPWPVEINPRYTASVEVLERSYGAAFLSRHRDACLGIVTPHAPLQAGALWGKAIVYAREPMRFPAEGPWLTALHDAIDIDRVEFADIPHAGADIGAGEPILTVFASATDPMSCEHLLREKCTALDRCLYPG